MSTDDMTPRLLCIAHDFPYPPDNGSSVRVLDMVGMLAELGRVRLVAQPRPTTTPEDVAQVTAAGAEVVLGPAAHMAGLHGPRLWIHAMRRRTPPWYLLWSNDEVTDLVRSELSWATHVVALDDFAAQYVLHLPPTDARVIIDKHKVYGVPGVGRQRPATLFARLRQTALLPMVRLNERRTLERADAVIVTTDEESRRLHNTYGRSPDAVITTTVEAHHTWSPGALVRGGGDPPTVLWLGNLDYGPNREGLRRVFEYLAATPDQGGFQLAVVGRGDVGDLRTVVEGLPVSFLGYVEELTEIVSASSAAIVPLWSGAGVKVKTLDLLGRGIPVVATPVALEGSGAQPGFDCLVGDDPAALVDQLHRVIADRSLAADLGARGFALVHSRHNRATHLQQLRALLGGLDGQESPDRPANRCER